MGVRFMHTVLSARKGFEKEDSTVSTRVVEECMPEKVVLLGTVSVGNLVRFSNVSYAEAMADRALWFVEPRPKDMKDDDKRVTLKSIDLMNPVFIRRDPEWTVVIHHYEIHVIRD